MNYDEQIEEYLDQYDSENMLKLIPDVLEQSVETQKHLYESLESLIQLLYYDDACGKLIQYDKTTGEKCPANPSELGILELIEGMEQLGQTKIALDKGSYFSFLTSHPFFENQPEQVLAYCRLCEPYLLEAMQVEPGNVRPLLELAQAYKACAKLHIPESETYWRKALEQYDRACLLFSDSDSWARKLYFLNEPWKNFSSTGQALWQAAITDFFKAVRVQATANPFFAITLGRVYQRLLDHPDVEVEIPRLEAEWQALLEWGMAWSGDHQPDHLPNEVRSVITSGQNTKAENLMDAGHLYSKAGEHFKNEAFLLQAANYFNIALTLDPGFALMIVYLAQAQEALADLKLAQGDRAASEALHAEIRRRYLDRVARYTPHLSLLSHATEYLMKYAEALDQGVAQREWMETIYPMLLDAEKVGEGYYWFPYERLFKVCLHLGRVGEAKLWVKRGYLRHNMVVEEQLRALIGYLQAQQQMGLIPYIQTMLDEIARGPNYYDGGKSYAEISQLTIEDVE